jgi:5'-nucleotidase
MACVRSWPTFRPTSCSRASTGGNLGEDVTYSGTVAAAMEAALLGFRAIA